MAMARPSLLPPRGPRRVRVVDAFLLPCERAAFAAVRRAVRSAVAILLGYGLSPSDVEADLDREPAWWGFGPWRVVVEDGTVFVVAACPDALASGAAVEASQRLTG